MVYADRLIAFLMFFANAGFMIAAGIYNPALVVVVSAPFLLHGWRNGFARLFFAAVMFVQGFVLYAACDITNGPESDYLHPMHDLLPRIALYGLFSTIWILIENAGRAYIENGGLPPTKGASDSQGPLDGIV